MKEFCEKWWKRIATKEMVFIGIVTLLASLIASWLKQFPGFSLFGALIIALLIGMIVQFPIRQWYVGRSAEHKAGVKDAAGVISNKLLRLGIILLGFKLNLTVLFTQGIKCLPIAAAVVALTIVVCYGIARRLGVDPQLAILVAGGTGICGAAAAFDEACATIEQNAAYLTPLRDRLIAGLTAIPHTALNGDSARRLPGNVNVCFEDEKGIAASSGSACTSGSLDPSHVLLALGRPHEVAHGSLRLSLSHENRPEEIDYILEVLPGIVSYLRGMSPVWDELETGLRPHLI